MDRDTETLSPAQQGLLKAHFVVEARREHYRQRRDKIKNTKFHQPSGNTVLSSFDAIDYGDEDFDLAAPYGKGIFDHLLFGTTPLE